jgi:hypothetical protein
LLGSEMMVMMQYNRTMINKICLALLLSALIAACGVATTTPPPITPVETSYATPPSVLNPALLSKDSRECYVPDPNHLKYVSIENGFCLIYPSDFTLAGEETSNRISIVGPEIEGGPQPIKPTLTIQVQPADTKTYDQAVEDVANTFGDPRVAQTSVTIDGQPVTFLEGVHEQISTRQAVTLVNGKIFILTLSPTGEDYATAQFISNQVWATAMSTLHFFPPGATQATTNGVDTSDWAKQEFPGFGMRLLVPPLWQVNPQPDGFALAPRGNAVPTWIMLRSFPKLPAGDLNQLSDALKTNFQQHGISFGDIASQTFNNLPALMVKQETGLCQDIYIPAFDLVHQIAIHPDLCDPQGNITLDEAKAILESIEFYQAEK